MVGAQSSETATFDEGKVSRSDFYSRSVNFDHHQAATSVGIKYVPPGNGRGLRLKNQSASGWGKSRVITFTFASLMFIFMRYTAAITAWAQCSLQTFTSVG